MTRLLVCKVEHLRHLMMRYGPESLVIEVIDQELHRVLGYGVSSRPSSEQMRSSLLHDAVMHAEMLTWADAVRLAAINSMCN